MILVTSINHGLLRYKYNIHAKFSETSLISAQFYWHYIINIGTVMLQRLSVSDMGKYRLAMARSCTMLLIMHCATPGLKKLWDSDYFTWISWSACMTMKPDPSERCHVTYASNHVGGLKQNADRCTIMLNNGSSCINSGPSASRLIIWRFHTFRNC